MALAAKRKEISTLLNSLRLDLTSASLAPSARLTSLTTLKIHGREPTGCEEIYSKDGIPLLTKLAIKYHPTTSYRASSREALRCLANALFLDERCRSHLIDADGELVEGLSEMYNSEGCEVDDEFLLGRILFFTTYAASKSQVSTWSSTLLSGASKALHRHAITPERGQMGDMALTETCKLIFNLQVKLGTGEQETKLFSSSVGDLFIILRLKKLLNPPIQSPIKDVLNVLSNIDFTTTEVKESVKEGDVSANVERLVEMMDVATRGVGVGREKGPNEKDEFDDNGASLVKVVYESYPVVGDDLQAYMRKKLLPTEEERDKPLGKSSSLAARILTITTSALAPNTRTLLSALLYQLSHNNPAQFVQNVGYGFASGYLMSQGIAIPPEAMNVQERAGEAINPITGQRLDKEVHEELPEMTDEEKEREAERLFVLFERLRATGVVDVENPVRRYQQEGRFEELDDDDK